MGSIKGKLAPQGELLPLGWADVKAACPLVFHITNIPASPLQANVCLAVGAEPVMSRHPGEASDIAAQADAFLLNLGTPTRSSIEAAKAAADVAEALGTFTVFDPVGCGLTKLRRRAVEYFLERHRFSVIKGNADEICTLAGVSKGRAAARGANSEIKAKHVERAVTLLAEQCHCVVYATGQTDVMSVNGGGVKRIEGGSALLPLVSGSGCAVGTLIAAAGAALQDAEQAALLGGTLMKRASERAEQAEKKTHVPFAAALVAEIGRAAV
ncbi:MAG: hydroxyethylthiazole kinase [Synergistaceae bacterium]|nr:hydroxyethylthiazole kinase [Synergistaceae bacterium]